MRPRNRAAQSVSWALVVLVAAGAFTASGFSFKKKKNAPQEEPAAEASAPVPVDLSAVEQELADLKKSYEQLEADRDNVLQQTRVLLSEKSKITDVQAQNEKLKAENARYARHEKVMSGQISGLRSKLGGDSAAVEDLQRKYADLSKRHAAIDQENEQLARALAGKIGQDPEFRKLVAETQAIRKENDSLRGVLKKTNEDREKAVKQTAALQVAAKKSAEEISALKQKITSLENARRELMEHGQKLIKEVERAPHRFGEMAQENKLLIRETSDMHYNLGVFFAEGRHYDRAVKEFERALDFNPNNAKVHYNLGYLYAEQLKRHDEAMNHFQRYLDLDPNTKESEDVRKYLLVRQTYGDAPLLDKKERPKAKF